MDLLNKSGSALQYLLDYKDGKIKHGLELENGLEEYLKFKRKQINIILTLTRGFFPEFCSIIMPFCTVWEKQKKVNRKIINIDL